MGTFMKLKLAAGTGTARPAQKLCPSCFQTTNVTSCFDTMKACDSQESCYVEIRTRDGLITQAQMGCKQTHACHNEAAQNKMVGPISSRQCRPSSVFGPSICRKCCDGSKCYRTLGMLKWPKVRKNPYHWRQH